MYTAKRVSVIPTESFGSSIDIHTHPIRKSNKFNIKKMQFTKLS